MRKRLNWKKVVIGALASFVFFGLLGMAVLSTAYHRTGWKIAFHPRHWIYGKQVETITDDQSISAVTALRLGPFTLFAPHAFKADRFKENK